MHTTEVTFFCVPALAALAIFAKEYKLSVSLCLLLALRLIQKQHFNPQIDLALFIFWAGVVVAPLSKSYLKTISIFAITGILIGLSYQHLGSAYPWVLRGSRLAAVYVTISATVRRYGKGYLTTRELANYTLPAGQICGLAGVWAWGDFWKDWWLAEVCSLLTLSVAGCILTLCMKPPSLKSWQERSS